MIILKKHKVYLDNCCFNRPYDNQKQERIHLESLAKLYIQQQIIDGNISFVWSFILEYENSQNPHELRKQAISQFSYRSREYFDAQNKNAIIRESKGIMDSGIKAKDSLHIACAILSSCDYFITTDDKLLKYKTDKIKLTDPVQFVREMEENDE